MRRGSKYAGRIALASNYTLQDRQSNRWLVGGTVEKPKLSANYDDAIVISGTKLASMVGWSKSFEAHQLDNVGNMKMAEGTEPYHLVLLEFEDNKWWSAGSYFYKKLDSAVHFASEYLHGSGDDKNAAIIAQGPMLIGYGGKGMNEALAMKHGTGTVNRLTQKADKLVFLPK